MKKWLHFFKKYQRIKNQLILEHDTKAAIASSKFPHYATEATEAKEVFQRRIRESERDRRESHTKWWSVVAKANFRFICYIETLQRYETEYYESL